MGPAEAIDDCPEEADAGCGNRPPASRVRLAVEIAAFEAIFDHHYGAVVAYARRRGASWDEAQDVAAEVFAVAWRRQDRLSANEPLPWLLATARRVLANHRRGRRRWRALVSRVAGTMPVEYQASPGMTNDGQLAAALAGLPERDREVLRLVAWDGLTHAEAAHVLGISESGVSNRVARARARLQRALGARAEDEVGGS